MEYYKVLGGNPLNGEVRLHGAKNSALPILAATLLVKGVSVIHNCPNLSDVKETIDILKGLGCRVTKEEDTVTVDATNVSGSKISEDSMRAMRSSILFLGSLVARTKSASIYLPGGCDIGTRPIDLHIKALRELGAEINENGSSIVCSANKIIGKKIILPFPSVGATENIILAAATGKGITTIINSAREPEICDFADFLNKSGARIKGAGNTVITVEGVECLNSVEHRIIPDRILASTYMSACAGAGGKISLVDVRLSHLTPVLPVFDEMGCKLYVDNGRITIEAPKRLKRVKSIKTMPYPGFPTDSQAPIVAALSVATGTSVIQESIFENRFRYVNQLNRFGTDIKTNNEIAVVNGVKYLHPATVYATDLRGGASMVVASLIAKGDSVIYDLEHIDRGYESFEDGLNSLGANIKRIKYEKGQ